MAPPKEQIIEDLDAYLAGATRSTLGRMVFEKLEARLVAFSTEYLDVLIERHLQGTPDLFVHSNLQLPRALRALAQHEPKRVAIIATELLRLYTGALAQAASKLTSLPEEDQRTLLRLESRRKLLAKLLGQKP